MKKFGIISSWVPDLPPRQLMLRILARIHCGLLAGILFAIAFAMLPVITVPVSTGPGEAFWRGILFAIPTALCYYAIKGLPEMWKFLLAALGLCGLSWLLTGHPGGAVLMAVMCLFRVRVRMQEDEDGHPIQSMFDTPGYFDLLLFVLAFFVSAGVGIPELQKISLVGALLYLLVCLAFNGVKRMDDYLVLNKDMSGLPERRIQRIAGAAVLATVALTAVLLFPAALSSNGDMRITMPDLNKYAPEAIVTPEPYTTMPNEGPINMDLSEMFGEPSWQMPEWVSYVLFAIIGVILLAGFVTGVRSFLKNFLHSHSEGHDIVQRLDRADNDQGEFISAELKKPSFWDRSPNAVIRRRYRKAILKGKETPRPSHSPTELENAAGIDNQRLHLAYEKARYSENGCTSEDVASLRR